MYIAVDFDGTVAEHDFPRIGKPVPGAFKWLKRLKTEGATLILWTCRHGERLQEAIDFCEKEGIVFEFVNENPKYQNISNKVYADIYIDDSTFGCPIKWKPGSYDRPTVDWRVVGPSVLRTLVQAAPKPSLMRRIWNFVSFQPVQVGEEMFASTS